MLWQQSALAAIALIDVCVERFGQAGARRLIGAKVLPAWCERLSDAMARIDGTSAGREGPHLSVATHCNLGSAMAHRPQSVTVSSHY